MRELIAVDTAQGPRLVEEMLRIWEAGDALLPVDHRLPVPARKLLFDQMRPSAVIDRDGARHRLDGGVPVLGTDALVVPTSGSTGTPKGVIHTHASIEASARATNRGVGTEPATDRWLCCLPLSHVAGLSVITRALVAGCPLEVLDGFDPAAVAQAGRAGATLTTLVPTALARIEPTLFRRIVVGGSHPPAHLPDNCLVSYGLTETGSAVAYDGRPLDGAEIAVDDSHDTCGEIRVRGPMLLRAYRSSEPEGTDPFDASGWFVTGDIGSFGDDGMLSVHGRRGDMIITGGENVWPAAVERVLMSHPAIERVVVVGRADPDWGEQVVAVVVPVDLANPPSLDEVRDHCKAQVPGFAAPRAMELVEQLPSTPLGKVLRAHGSLNTR